MTWLLLIIIGVLLLYIVYSHLKINKKNKDMNYIINILNQISTENAQGRIRLSTYDKRIKSLCLSINEFLTSFNNLKVSEAESNEAMKKMLSNISHDLRTPLTVMLGYIEQLNINTSISDDEKKMYLNKLEAKIYEVSSLINEFFSLTKLESGDEYIELEQINASEVLKETILGFYDTLESKEIAMDIHIPENDVYCFGNIKALKRILNNLITNSIKYGFEGKVIGIKLYEKDNLVWIEQWDRGKGIADTEYKKVFERLYTLEDSRNKNYQGSGLGLTIVQTLIHKMQGEITIESIPYKKTTFKFYLKKHI
ncbi:sensor histidine kinase [Clostridium omnivorum]|uniref:histidine kinase n=1 Tax=Clostridium omnivorum TaxID=1604902 RepID=A0ABQ5N9Z3_9CLOT|nr:HAMP domain-containing sensor histidine kinase [Clostridium sp. E14]GLC31997.1 two-component sensor histidine kinase [Clostridium sp. E14]